MICKCPECQRRMRVQIRWIYRAIQRATWTWLITCNGVVPLNGWSLTVLNAVVNSAMSKFRIREPRWGFTLTPPNAEQRAMRMGPTITLTFDGEPI